MSMDQWLNDSDKEKLIGDGSKWNLLFYLERLATNCRGMACHDLGRPQLNYVVCEVSACILQEGQSASVRSVDKCQIGTAVCCKIHTCVWAKCGLWWSIWWWAGGCKGYIRWWC